MVEVEKEYASKGVAGTGLGLGIAGTALGLLNGNGLGGLLGLDPGFAAALGLIGLFCCATNSPFASIVLSVEMFGGVNLYPFALICVVCFVLSGNSGLYASQIIQFNKTSMAGSSCQNKDV